MNHGGKASSTGAGNSIFAVIAATERRRILRAVLDEESPLDTKKLATSLAANGSSPTTSDWKTVIERTETELVHRHLPVFSEIGLLNWNRDDSTVAVADHPAFDDPRFELLLETTTDGVESVLSTLSNERRRILLTTLREAGRPVSRSVLAREIVREERGEATPASEAVDDVTLSLYHVHLPKLADTNFVEYEPETGHVAYSDHPALEEVFTIIFEPDERLVDSYDEFLDGLEAALPTFGRQTSQQAEWPNFWDSPRHG